MWIKITVLCLFAVACTCTETKKKEETRGKRNLEYSISHTYPHSNPHPQPATSYRSERRISNAGPPRYPQYFPGRPYTYFRKGKPQLPPPYAVQMEPLVHYSQRDPLYDPSAHHFLRQPHNELTKPDDLLGDNNHLNEHVYGPPKHYIERPVYIKEPEPIIEIIIKEANTTAAPPPPAPLPVKKKKEEVQVFYVKYKKNPNGTGKDSVVYDKPIPAISKVQGASAEEHEEEHSYGAPEPPVTYSPPATTTIRAIIKPDSETYHANSGIHITFGGAKHNPEAEKYSHDDEIVESAPEPALLHPQGRRFPEFSNGNKGNFQNVAQEYRPEQRIPQPYKPFNFNQASSSSQYNQAGASNSHFNQAPSSNSQFNQAGANSQFNHGGSNSQFSQGATSSTYQSFARPSPPTPQFSQNFNQQSGFPAKPAPPQFQQNFQGHQPRPYQPFEQRPTQTPPFQFPKPQTHFPISQQPPLNQPAQPFNPQFSRPQSSQQNRPPLPLHHQQQPTINHHQSGNLQQQSTINHHTTFNHHQQNRIQQQQHQQHGNQQHQQHSNQQQHNNQQHQQHNNQQHQQHNNQQHQQHNNQQQQQIHHHHQQPQHQPQNIPPQRIVHHQIQHTAPPPSPQPQQHSPPQIQQSQQIQLPPQRQHQNFQIPPTAPQHNFQNFHQHSFHNQQNTQNQQYQQFGQQNSNNDFRQQQQQQFNLNNIPQSEHIIPPGGELIAALPKFEQHISIPPSPSTHQDHLSSQEFNQKIQQQFRSITNEQNYNPQPQQSVATSYAKITGHGSHPSHPVLPTNPNFVYQTTQRPSTTRRVFYSSTTPSTTTTTTTPAPTTTQKVESTTTDLKALNIELPDEVPDDLREQLLSSGILKNAQISVLDYDKVGDIPISALPPDQLANFYNAGGGQQIAASEPKPTVLKLDGSKVDAKTEMETDQEMEGSEVDEVKVQQPVEMKVVHYDPQTEQGQSVHDSYVKEGATQVEPVVLNDQTYNRYLPLKVSGAQFPIPDVPELKGKNINSVVVLAPVDYNFKRVTRKANQVDDELKYVRNDALKELLKDPSGNNYKKFLEKENNTASDKQSVILLVTGSAKEREIFMYDVASQSVSKLDGELSAAFVDAAETNAAPKVSTSAAAAEKDSTSAAASNRVETKVLAPEGLEVVASNPLDDMELEGQASDIYESKVPIIDPSTDLEADGSEQFESFVDVSGFPVNPHEDLSSAASEDNHVYVSSGYSKTEYQMPSH